VNQTSEKEIIKAEAEKLGFCFSGFTDPRKPDHFPRYLDWIEAGKYAGMNYLARHDHIEKRKNPAIIYPDCRSILVLGISICYEFEPSFFSVASFARYWDYHHQITELCGKLIDRISSRLCKDVHAKICTDSSPILERSLAVQAGLGWIGRNSMLIHPKYGSTTLLAECLLDIEIEPDPPYNDDRCGKCRLCVDTCPTKCIDPNTRTIDAGRCIAYQTVENHGEIEPEIAALCGNQIFGCDVCVKICPWNQKNLVNQTPLSLHHIVIGEMKDLDLSDAEFKEKYQETPILRTKNSGLKRNIRNALHNLAEGG
jgi:epoxyqueuosine reductase